MPKKPKTRANKQSVFEAIDDLVARLLIHDRQDDDDLPEGEIEKMIAAETITVDDLAEKFKESLEEHLEDLEPKEEDDEEEEDDLDLDDDDDED